jgi:hypothetical protein
MANNVLLFNPLTSKLDLVRDAVTTATRVVIAFDCDASLAVGDIVYQDAITDTFVNKSVNNTEVQPSIGVVITKLTTVRAEVLILGLQAGFAGLSIGAKAFLGTTGGVTSTKPATGYVQTLGVAVSSTQIFFQPNAQRVLQTP